MTEATESQVRRLDLHEAAAMADCSYQTVWRAVNSGELPATRRKPGGHWKVREDDLLAWAFPQEHSQ